MGSGILAASRPTDVKRADDLVADLPAPENKRFYPALDGLRALAVLAVFFQHYLTIRPALSWGWSGVDLFFVLSGFLITGILYDTRNTAHRFRNFYVRRILRIFPLYYGVFLVALLLIPVFHWVWDPRFLLWPLYLGNYNRFLWVHTANTNLATLVTLTSSRTLHDPFRLNFGHFWSLCQEEQFYLIWPPIVFFLRDRVKLRNLCALLCVLSLFARIAYVYLAPQAYQAPEFIYTLFPVRADGLLLGGMLALMLRGPEAKWLVRLAQPAIYCLLSGWLLLEAIYPLIYHRLYLSKASPGLQTFGYSLVDLFAGALILSALVEGSRLYRFLTLKPLRQLGQMSYGFYVFHDIPHIAYIRVVEHILPGNAHGYLLVALIGFVATLILSYLSFRFYESPFLRLKERFTASLI
jgi:peptidoglycan/LPS O-acetylase OafA/YrhL